MRARAKAPPRHGRPPLPAAGDEPGAGHVPQGIAPGPTRTAVILPWERSERSQGDPAAPADQARAAEARLAEAIGLAASIALVIVHSAILPLRARRPSTLLGEGQVAAQGQGIAAQRA